MKVIEQTKILSNFINKSNQIVSTVLENIVDTFNIVAKIIMISQER